MEKVGDDHDGDDYDDAVIVVPFDGHQVVDVHQAPPLLAYTQNSRGTILLHYTQNSRGTVQAHYTQNSTGTLLLRLPQLESLHCAATPGGRLLVLVADDQTSGNVTSGPCLPWQGQNDEECHL